MTSNPRFYGDWCLWASGLYPTLPPEKQQVFGAQALQVIGLMGAPVATFPRGKGLGLALQVLSWLSRNPDPFAEARRQMEAMQKVYGALG